jgi:hypothetical protein
VKNVLLDTNAYVAFKRGQPEVIEIIQRALELIDNSESEEK